MTAFNTTAYYEETFSKLVIKDECIEHIEFQGCQFNQCKFMGVAFNKVTFIDCDFDACDLSLATFKGCKFSEVSFKNANLAGINWTELNWPLVKLTSPLYFHSSNISHSSFYSLDLTDLIIEDCKAHDVDFRETNLNHASFVGSDLQNSLFMHTNLKQADFTNATNYSIDPQINSITQARFSVPEVMSLLNYFDIKINDYDM